MAYDSDIGIVSFQNHRIGLRFCKGVVELFQSTRRYIPSGIDCRYRSVNRFLPRILYQPYSTVRRLIPNKSYTLYVDRIWYNIPLTIRTKRIYDRSFTVFQSLRRYDRACIELTKRAIRGYFSQNN